MRRLPGRSTVPREPTARSTPLLPLLPLLWLRRRLGLPVMLPLRLLRLLQLLPLLLPASLCLARMAAAALPDAAALEFRQHPGQAMPLVQGLRDQDGRAAGLADYLGKTPVIFVLGYYHCPMLCSTLMDAVLERVRGVGVRAEVLAVSIDPSETPADAARKYGYYSGLLRTPTATPQDTRGATPATPATAPAATQLHLLTATPSAIAALTDAVGFPYQRDPETGQYYHPAGFVILTPEGRISRYFLGLGFTARDVRLALVEASHGKVGGLADRLVLLCSHYDPATGRYNVAAMAMARAAGLGTLLALLFGLYLLRRRGRGNAAAPADATIARPAGKAPRTTAPPRPPENAP